MSDDILYLDGPGVETALAGVDVVEAVHDALAQRGRGESVLPDEAYLRWEPPSGGWAWIAATAPMDTTNVATSSQ